MSKICIVGTWHQASVVSACLADLGHEVWGVGDDEQAIAALSQGRPLVHEPELPEIMARNLAAGRLAYTTDYSEALDGASFALIAIDTPVLEDDSSHLTTVFRAAEQVGRYASAELILCVSAQVPVGTSECLRAEAQQHSAFPVHIVCVPEFLRLGNAVTTFKQADRFVIGCDDPFVREQVADLYRPLGRPILVTTLRSAEMIKHTCNAFLANSISFINEIADLCEVTGADVLEVAKGMKLDRRIGPHAFLGAGLGFAGGTLGRDILTLQGIGIEHGLATLVMDATLQVNRSRPGLVMRQLRRVYEELSGLLVGVWGLTYKPGTSTLRRAISLEIVRALVEVGARVQAYDPLANLSEVAELPPFAVCEEPLEAAQGSDALVLITKWAGIQTIDLGAVRHAMRRPVLLDTGNLFQPEEMREMGFIYFGVGRGGAWLEEKRE